MNKIFQLMTVAIATVALSACATKKEPVVVTKYEPIPEQFIKDVRYPIPPTIETYKKMPWTTKERELSRLLVEAYKSIKQANDQFEALRQLNEGLLEINSKVDEGLKDKETKKEKKQVKNE